MDSNKIKTYLDKINLLYKSVSSDNKISRIERDLMLSYIRDLYDAFLEEDGTTSKEKLSKSSNKVKSKSKKDKEKQKSSTPPPTYTPPVYQPKVEPKVEPTEEKPLPPKTTYVPPKVETKIPDSKPPVFEVEDKRKTTTPPPPPAPKPTYTPPPKPTYTPPPSAKLSNEMTELFTEETVKELSQKLSQRPIKDLKTAMGINERFLFINELFHGDKGAYNATIDDLNRLNSFEEAKSYLAASVVNQMDWLEDKRIRRAKDFIQLVRRRYL